MQHQTLKVMAVDDDKTNLEILMKNLKDSGYDSIGFEDGDTAWTYLAQNPEEIDIILLDKMMPRMDGMEVLDNIKSHSLLRNIPVIIQTGDVENAKTEADRLKANLTAGAYYYLEKPFDPSVMVSLVNAAARDCVRRNELLHQMKQETSITQMIREGRFCFRTVEEANKLAAALAYHASKPEEAGVALAELMVNAVEHGNLNIGYDLKNTLISENRWEEEITRRLSLPEYKNKVVNVEFLCKNDESTVIITDQGAGFNWRKYSEFDPLRLTDPNGRGVAAARLMGVKIEYLDQGNKVMCTFPSKLPEKN